VEIPKSISHLPKARRGIELRVMTQVPQVKGMIMKYLCLAYGAEADWPAVNQIVKLPRWRRLASYAAQLVTLHFCFGIWWRRATLALDGMGRSG